MVILYQYDGNKSDAIVEGNSEKKPRPGMYTSEYPHVSSLQFIHLTRTIVTAHMIEILWIFVPAGSKYFICFDVDD